MLFRLPILSLFTTLALANPISTKVCNFETLTERCKLFDPHKGEKIELPDGTFIPNFSAILKAQEARGLVIGGETEEKARQTKAKLLLVKYEIMRLLEEVPDAVMHPLFKLHMSENFGYMLELLYGSEAEELEEVRLPWPPENPMETASVKIPVLRERIAGIFGAKAFDKMAALRKESLAILREGNKGRSPIFEEMRDYTKERQLYVEKMVEFAKKRIIALISQERALTQLSEAERTAIRRVETVRFTDPRLVQIRLSSLCAKPVPNAFYNRADHSINVCPNFFNFPDSTILSVLAHEIGHVVDPCLSQFKVYQIRRARFEALKRQGEVKPIEAIAANRERMQLYQILAKIVGFTDVTAYPLPLYASPAAVQYFEEAQILISIVPAIAAGQYVFKDVYQCLRNDFRGFSNQDVKRVAKQVTELRRQFRDPSYDAKADEARIVAGFTAYPDCVDAEKHSQMGEVMADWISSRVLGEFLVGMRLETNLERLGPLAYFGNLVCMERHRLSRDSDGSLADVLKAATRDYASSLEAHPGSRDRIEKIFLADKNIRTALGCEGPPPKSCPHKRK